MKTSDIASMAPGDAVELPSLMPGLTQERVYLVLRKVSEDGQRREFVVTWLGATLGRWHATSKGETLYWGYDR